MDKPEETEVIERLAPAVLLRAKRLIYGRPGWDSRDLAQIGLIRILVTVRGGVTGTDGFLLQRASWTMRKALNREVARGAVEVASIDDPEMNPNIEPIVAESPSSALQEEEGALWRKATARLTSREKQVVAALHQRHLTQQQTASCLGMSQPRFNQIYRNAVSKMRSSLTGHWSVPRTDSRQELSMVGGSREQAARTIRARNEDRGATSKPSSSYSRRGHDDAV